MTAIRNFPNAPQALTPRPAVLWRVPGFALGLWMALHRYGQRRAARELALLANRYAHDRPLLARQLRESAAQCSLAAQPTPHKSQATRSAS